MVASAGWGPHMHPGAPYYSDPRLAALPASQYDEGATEKSMKGSKKNFKPTKPTDAPLVANDGTLIFQHPTIRNYFDKTDKPELKDNPYNTMMNPFFGHGYGGYGYPGGYPYGGYGHHGHNGL